MLRQGTCIGFLPDAGCGLIYDDCDVNGSRIVFVHFRDIQPVDGWQGLCEGDRVQYVIDSEKGLSFYRPWVASGVDSGFVQVIARDNDHLLFCTVEDIDTGCVDLCRNKIVITGDIPEGWGPPTEAFAADMLFYHCRWQGKANFSGWRVKGALVFLGCAFTDAFTLKEARIDGAVHMEGCDFSGAGGASFRGLEARALYLDFGVKGPRDMVWLNEICIRSDVIVGGIFEGAVQVMRVQDARVPSETCENNELYQRPCFQRLLIGKEFYKSQSINRSVLQGMLDVRGLSHGEVVQIEHSELGDLNMCELDGGVLLGCSHSKVMGSVALSGKNERSLLAGIDLQNSYIEGHLSVDNATIQADLNLDDATVGRVIRVRRVSFQCQGGLKLARLSANRFVMDDFCSLYGLKGPSGMWENSRFGMLSREGLHYHLDKGPPVELIQEYVLLKNLLSQEGQLKLEDEAFYNMRKLGHWYQDMSMFLFNYVFGWGVRLQNILVSVLIMIASYAAIYNVLIPSTGPLRAVQLSVQAMFMAFFGELEPKVMAGSGLSWVVLSESVLGIIFATVFVGAYVRKLLR